jgi:hypothetical protein
MVDIFHLGTLATSHAATFDRDETRAEAFDARVVLVARGLIDNSLATKLGLKRLDRNAV